MRIRRGQGAVRWMVVIGALVGLGAVAAVILFRVLRPAVSVTQVVQGPVVQAFYATGTISPDQEYPIKAHALGIITEVRVTKGQAVQKGDVLAVLQNDELPLKLKQAEADLNEKRQLADEQASPSLHEFDARIAAYTELGAIAERERKRLSDALEKNAASQSDLDKALDRLKTVWSDLESAKAARATKKLSLEREAIVAQAAFEMARWNFDQLTMRSPIDGVVLDRPVPVGTRVPINEPLMRVADVRPENLVMRAAVDEEDKVKVNRGLARGMKVYMRLYSFQGEDPLEGTVAKVYPQADAERRTFEVDVKLDKPNADLAAGMTGELNFVVEQKPVADVVPAQAIQAGAIWVVRDGRLARLEAKIGLRSVERVELLTALQPNDWVVISPVGSMKVGQQVRVGERVDPRVAASLNTPAEQSNFKGFN